MSATDLPPTRVLVTGCAGRVGVAACADLLAAGHDVCGIDVREPDADRDAGIDFRLCDLTQVGALAPHLQHIDAVLHLAAIPVPRQGTPDGIFELNCAGTFRLFQACAEAGIGHVVVASSINAIGYFFGTVPFELNYLPVDEDHPRSTSDAYSFSKQITEDIGAYFARREGIHNICLRFGAGLSSLSNQRQQQADDLRDTQAAVQRLAALGAQAAHVELQRMQAAFDEARRGRAYEGGSKSQLPVGEQRLMSLRHNYFSFIELGEACRAMRLALTTPFRGHHTLFIVDRHNYPGLPAQLLADLLYPGVPHRSKLVGDQSLVDWRRAANLLSFDSVIPATMLLET
ncbi:MAG: NAD(P)-dependent oxidoreductase [bacterium]|nr:NAD(P)-dependent oxidoreductase [bacterium]